MRLTAKQKIRVAFGLLLILPTVLCVLAVRTINNLIETAENVDYIERVLTDLNETLIRLKDVEVDQREYMLTGDPLFLAQFVKSKESVFKQIEKVEGLTSQNKHFQDTIELLKNVVIEKFDEVYKTNELRRTGGIAAASEVLKNELGRAPMDDIRNLLTRMINDERASLQRNRQQQRAEFKVIVLVFAVVLLLNFFFVFFLRYFIKREVMEHEREEQRIRELNQQLERRVQERTVQLQRSNEDLEQFAYVVSHDLKEPLRMVSSYTELLQRRYEGRLDEQADEFIGYAIQGVRRMNSMIEDLLLFSRAATVGAETPRVVSSAESLEAALSNLQVRIQETGAAITRGNLPEVSFDATRLTQVFQNLIGNALKYRAEVPPAIHIDAKENGHETIFSVRDNGIGIDPKDKEKLFGLFQRLHGREFEGTGIGLATCKKIVERGGGRIWVESRPGEGSTFYFTVPHVKESALEETKELVARK